MQESGPAGLSRWTMASRQESNRSIECVSRAGVGIFGGNLDLTAFYATVHWQLSTSTYVTESQPCKDPYFVMYCTVSNIDRGEES